jgi:predicted ATP-dependent Lon-type protease
MLLLTRFIPVVERTYHFIELGPRGTGNQDLDAIQITKVYMANGWFSRGIAQVHAETSLVFIGNFNQPVETLV